MPTIGRIAATERYKSRFGFAVEFPNDRRPRLAAQFDFTLANKLLSNADHLT
jgi:hypothetical protein